MQPEGDTNFKNLIPQLQSLLTKINKPVVVKEVGHGVDRNTAIKVHPVVLKLCPKSIFDLVLWS